MMKNTLSILMVIFVVDKSSMSVDFETKAKSGSNPLGLNGSYDFIIIGGGSAGCLLANRLSKMTHWKILLLEAGEDETFSSKVPFFPYLSQKTKLDWNFTSTKQANACQSLGGYCEVPRGRVLGGSSSINFMMHMRGVQEDFNTWEAEGNQGWSYKEISHFFEQTETHVTPSEKESENDDLLPVKEVEQDWWSSIFCTALSEFGLHQANLNQGLGRGFMLHQLNVRHGARVSANTAFLKPAMKRSNLVVLTSSLVKRILIDNRTATGVEFEHKNKTYSVFASKEVILSAGSINSPQILMLSGIGPADELKQFGLPVVQDLPVGWSLQDHLGMTAKFLIKNQTTKPKDDAMESIQQYLYNQTGLLGMTDGRIVALMNSSFATSSSPDMELLFGRGAEENVFYISAFLGKPESRGKLSLRSDSPYDPPSIDFNYLSTERDLKVMREMVDIIFELVFSTSLKNLEPLYIAPDPWLCENSTDFIGCLFKQYSQTFYHPVSTCKMGPTNDSYAVVDSELKVYGMNALRVVDASVMPCVPSANINAPTTMVAEKASNMIIREHKCG